MPYLKRKPREAVSRLPVNYTYSDDVPGGVKSAHVSIYAEEGDSEATLYMALGRLEAARTELMWKLKKVLSEDRGRYRSPRNEDRPRAPQEHYDQDTEDGFEVGSRSEE